MNIEVWPFLVSRNKVFDYRTVIAPEFMVEKKIASLLMQATEGNLTEPGYIMYREIHGSRAGDISLLFRIIRAQSHHIGLAGSEELKDQYGRTIDVIEGLVMQGRVPEIVVTSGTLQYAHEQMQQDYRVFWDDIIRTPTMHLSKSFYLPEASDIADRLKVKVLAPLNIEPESSAEP